MAGYRHNVHAIEFTSEPRHAAHCARARVSARRHNQIGGMTPLGPPRRGGADENADPGGRGAADKQDMRGAKTEYVFATPSPLADRSTNNAAQDLGRWSRSDELPDDRGGREGGSDDENLALDGGAGHAKDVAAFAAFAGSHSRHLPQPVFFISVLRSSFC